MVLNASLKKNYTNQTCLWHVFSFNFFRTDHLAFGCRLVITMEENNTSVEDANSILKDNFPINFANFNNDRFDYQNVVGTMVVFFGTILLIVGGAICCWYRYFRNREEDNADPENANSSLRYDGNGRRDTLVLNMTEMKRRQSRRDTLVLPLFTLH